MDDGSGVKSVFSTTLAIVVAFAAASVIVVLAGEPVSALFDAIWISVTSEGLGYTLFYATPMILTGLSVALCFHAGLFNIGGEGQLYLGSLTIIAIAQYFPAISPLLAIGLGIIAAITGGSLWGAIPGVLKAYRGSHEVIVTILLNFIAYAILDYSILYLFQDPTSQSPETFTIPSSFQLPTLDQLLSPLGIEWFRSTPANATVLIAVLCALILWIVLYRTPLGFEIRVAGTNPAAGRFAGISIGRTTVLTFAIAGGLSGLVGVNEIMGYEHRLIQGFSPQYGFTGIAVALLSRNHPIGVVFSGLLFGILHNMSREIEFSTTHVSKELSLVIQAILIGFIAALPALKLFRFSRGVHG